MVIEIFHVALLQFVVRASDVGIEADVLRQIVVALLFQDFKPLRLVLRLFKGFERLEVGGPIIVERILPVLVFLPRGGFACGVARGVCITKGEVGRVVGHGVTLCSDVETCARYAEVFVDNNVFSNIL